jgi:hypothetical protein
MTASFLYSPSSSMSESSGDSPSEAREGSCSPLLGVSDEVRTKVADTEVISLTESASDHGLIVVVVDAVIPSVQRHDFDAWDSLSNSASDKIIRVIFPLQTHSQTLIRHGPGQPEAHLSRRHKLYCYLA